MKSFNTEKVSGYFDFAEMKTVPNCTYYLSAVNEKSFYVAPNITTELALSRKSGSLSMLFLVSSHKIHALDHLIRILQTQIKEIKKPSPSVETENVRT